MFQCYQNKYQIKAKTGTHLTLCCFNARRTLVHYTYQHSVNAKQARNIHLPTLGERLVFAGMTCDFWYVNGNRAWRLSKIKYGGVG